MTMGRAQVTAVYQLALHLLIMFLFVCYAFLLTADHLLPLTCFLNEKPDIKHKSKLKNYSITHVMNLNQRGRNNSQTLAPN